MRFSDGGSVAYTSGNLLVDSLPHSDRDRIAQRLRVFQAEVPDCIVSHGQHFEDIIFPIDAVFSITAELRLGHVYEVAAIGRQGIVGAELALGVVAAPRSIMSQVEGHAARIDREAFEDCMRESPALERAVNRYFIRRLFIAEQNIACNFAHDVTQRCARWVLMLRDELGRGEFGLRKEFLGMMLGLEPRAAGDAATDLQRIDVVRYADERIAVVDGEALAEVSCECYEAQRRFAPIAA